MDGARDDVTRSNSSTDCGGSSRGSLDGIDSCATGVFYFVHEFKPDFREDAIFRHPDIVEEVTKMNQLIKSLAPVLKSPSISGTIAVSFDDPNGNHGESVQKTTYIFTVAMQNSPSTVRITVVMVTTPMLESWARIGT